MRLIEIRRRRQQRAAVGDRRRPPLAQGREVEISGLVLLYEHDHPMTRQAGSPVTLGIPSKPE